MDDREDDDPVIPFRDKLEGYRPLPPILAEKRRGWENPTHCRHRSLLYDLAARTIECKTCGIDVDPFQALITIQNFYQAEIEWKLEKIRDFEAKQKRDLEREDARRAKRRGDSAS